MPNKQKITDQNIGTFQTIYENYQVNPAFYENHEQSAELLNAVKLYEAHLASQQPPEIKEEPTPSRFLPDYLQPEPTQIDTYGVKPGTKAKDIAPTYKPDRLKSLDVEMPDTFDMGSLDDLVKSQEDSLVSISSQLPEYENKLKELDKNLSVLDVSQQAGDTKKIDSIEVRINEIKNRFTEIENINSEDLTNDQIDEINTEIAFLNNENKELHQQYTELATIYNEGIEKQKEQSTKIGELGKQYNETLAEYQDLVSSHNSIIGRLETNVNRFNTLIETEKGKVVPKIPIDDMGFVEDAKLLYKALSTGIGGGMENVPGVIARSIEGGNVEAIDEGKIANIINNSDLKQKMLALQGPEAQEKIFNLFTAGDIQQTLFQIPYSLIVMGATMGGKGVTTLLLRGASRGVVGLTSSAVALLAGGTVAYRATKNQFLRDQRDLMYRLTPDATEEMWENWEQAIAGSAHKYAMWEAVPEAVGNLLLAKLYMLPASKLFPVIANIESTVARKLASAFTKYSLTLAEEIPTETITQLGQGRIEALTGLREQVSESTWEEIKRSLGEILPQTIMTSAILAGAGGVISGTVEQFKGKRIKSSFEEKKIPMGVAEQKIISEVIEGIDEKPKEEPTTAKTDIEAKPIQAEPTAVKEKAEPVKPIEKPTEKVVVEKPEKATTENIDEFLGEKTELGKLGKDDAGYFVEKADAKERIAPSQAVSYVNEKIKPVEKPAPTKPKIAEKPKEAPIVPKEAEKPAEAKLPTKKPIVEPTVKEDKQLFTEIVKDIEKQIDISLKVSNTKDIFDAGKNLVFDIKSSENFKVVDNKIKIKSPQGEYEFAVPTTKAELKDLKSTLTEAFKKEQPIRVTTVPKRKPVLESLKVLQDKTAPPKRVEAAKAFLKEKGIGFSIAEVTHEVKKEESHIKVENSIKALSEKQKEISQIKDATTQEKAEVLKEYNQKAAETKKELTQLMSEDVKTKANLKKQAFVFNNLKSLVETTKESIEGQDISKKEKTEYNKALDGLLSILEDESGFILAGMIPKLSTFIKSKKDGTLTKKEVDLLNEKLKRDYTFGNEKFESEYQTDKTDDTHTLWGGLTNFFKDAWHKITREFEHLPKSKEFAEVAFILRMAQKQKGNASYKANKNISTIIDNLKHGDFNLFSRKVLLDDLVESVNRDEPLPRNWDADMVKEELSRLDIKIKDNEKVQEALDSRKEYWELLKKDYIDAMKLVGKNIKGMDRESYFRHLVLDYADAENYLGIYNKLKAPGNQSFLKKRVGSIRPIRTDYIMAEYDVIVRMVHDISVANIINAIKSKTDIISEVQEKTPEGEEWRKNIPEGYSVWQPEQGNFFFFANTIPDNIATDLLEGYLEEAEITKDQIRKVLALGGRKQEMVLRNEVIETLNNLNPPKSKNWVSGTLRWVTRKWKIWTLISPRRYIRYNLRNLTGDAEAAFVGNTTSFKKVPQATKELWAAFTGKKTMTDQLQDYFEMGGFEATLQSQEIKPVDELKPLITVNKSIFKKVWNGYWKAAKSSTDFRESILRYSNYISYLEQLEAGTLKNYGASMKAEVDALSSNKMKAYMLANDLLGAYDRVGVAGQSFRELLYPFWSWQEVNFKRYVRFVQNAADSDQLAGAVGRKLGAKTVLTSLRVGKYAIKAMGLWTMLTLWNNLKFPDEEKELSEQEKNTPHIIFGRDKNGEIISFNRLGTLGDFVEWFGLDAAPNNVAAYLKNRKTIKEISIEMLQSPVNKFAQGINPLLKAVPEYADRKSWFPDVFNRYTIRDRGVHLARSLGLENEYKAVTGKPSKKYAESIKNLAIYTTNPGQVAYSRNYTTKNKFLKKSKMTGYFMTDKGDAIYNYKAAIRYKDAKAAAKYYLDYYILMKIANPQLSDKKFENLVAKDMSKALVNMHPLSGLSKKTGVDLLYIAQLNFEEKIVLAKAIEYYEETLLRTADSKFAIEMNKEMVKLLK